MHDGGAPEWREIVEKAHARLIQDLAGSIESGRDRAVELAVVSERESARREWETERARAGRELEALQANVTQRIEAERNGFRKEIEALRESAKRDVEAERERGRIEMERLRRNSAAELEQARDSCTREIADARTSAAAALERAHAESAEALSKSGATARQACAEILNQSVRRLRDASSSAAVLEILADLGSAHAQRTVVLVFENNQARIASRRGQGLEAGKSPDGAGLESTILLDDAPALASAIETADPVTVLARESEVSSALTHWLASNSAEKLYLFPVSTRHQVVAMLVAAGEVFPAAVELLAGAAGMRLEAFDGGTKNPGVENLIRIQRTGVPASATSERRAWDDLSPEDQQLHLHAQRVARVRVARMRLDREDAWRRGLAQSDIYSALRRDIESARTEFLQNFLSRSTTMVDYLHLEILRNLANDDDRVLGREYPGPMV